MCFNDQDSTTKEQIQYDEQMEVFAKENASLRTKLDDQRKMLQDQAIQIKELLARDAVLQTERDDFKEAAEKEAQEQRRQYRMRVNAETVLNITLSQARLLWRDRCIYLDDPVHPTEENPQQHRTEFHQLCKSNADKLSFLLEGNPVKDTQPEILATIEGYAWDDDEWWSDSNYLWVSNYNADENNPEIIPVEITISRQT